MDDLTLMERALCNAASVQGLTAPNPWVGCVIVTPEGDLVDGFTHPPGREHAEVHALAKAGGSARGATMYVTLEPCAHHGRTPPCTDAIIAAGVGRVVVAMIDPDEAVRGRGIEALERAGVQVVVGVGAEAARDLLAPYVKHRLTGRPWVVLKLAATLDGRIAAPDGTSKWITGPDARADVQRLRAQSDAILVGAGTVRVDDPALTVRDVISPIEGATFEPLRVVLGSVPDCARVEPALALEGELTGVLDTLGRRGVVQVLVEGGATVAGEVHRAGLVDRYVFYLAPALFGGDDAVPLMAGRGVATIDQIWRGELVSVRQLGTDVRIVVSPEATRRGPAEEQWPNEGAEHG